MLFSAEPVLHQEFATSVIFLSWHYISANMEYSWVMQSMTRALLVVALSASALLAQDPFIGNWKLSLAKSKLTGQSIEIQEMSPGAFMFKEDEHSDFIFADGLDHLTHFGDSMAITIKDANTWAITYKRGDRVTMDTIWKVSPDSQKLTYTATGTRPNGQHFENKMILKRTGGTTGLVGLAGDWEAIDFELSSPREIDIVPYGADPSHEVRRQTLPRGWPNRARRTHLIRTPHRPANDRDHRTPEREDQRNRHREDLRRREDTNHRRHRAR
jgi:hypothetical protein